MNDKDYIKDLFSEKLGRHEAPVRADLWQGIQSQLGNTAAAAATKGLSVAGKWMIGVASSVVIAGTAVLLVPKSDPVKETEKVQVIPENKELPAEEVVSQQSVTAVEDVENQGKNKPVNAVHTETPQSEVLSEYPDYTEGATDYETFRMPVPPAERPVVKSQNSVERPKEDVAPEEVERPVAVAVTPKQEVREAMIGKLSNVITPNGDNDNDYLFVETQYLSDFQVTILNDKNQVVFSSSDRDFKWYGFDKFGEKVPAGKYFYYITAVDQAGNKINKYSPLQVVYQ